MNAADIEQAVRRLGRAIADRARSEGAARDLAIVGIRRGGVFLAQRLRAELAELLGASPPVGTLDIALYRDDLAEKGVAPVIGPTDIRFPVGGRTILLVDDVLYTGRTVRAALDALFDHGRAARVQLLVLIDRGWRELPIQADFVGRKVPTSASEVIKVSFESTDGASKVQILDRPGGA
jgi:pyrimidine operon attenuation protein/uracil phosphoribosyltransferase